MNASFRMPKTATGAEHIFSRISRTLRLLSASLDQPPDRTFCPHSARSNRHAQIHLAAHRTAGFREFPELFGATFGALALPQFVGTATNEVRLAYFLGVNERRASSNLLLSTKM